MSEAKPQKFLEIIELSKVYPTPRGPAVIVEGFVQYSLGLELTDRSVALIYESGGDQGFDIQVARMPAP